VLNISQIKYFTYFCSAEKRGLSQPRGPKGVREGPQRIEKSDRKEGHTPAKYKTESKISSLTNNILLKLWQRLI
jgi:hypothetical protein